MIYYELVEGRIGHNRNKIVAQMDVLPFKQREYESYVSMFGYEKKILQHIESTKALRDEKDDQLYPKGTVGGYKGNFFLDTLWFDVDSEDLVYARKTAIDFVTGLVSNYGIKLEDMYYFFSGGKGFHIGIDGLFFGGFTPSHGLPSAVKRLCKNMLSVVFEDEVENVKGNYKGFDTKIYNENRIFRLPNSKHQKSGLYKVMLSFKELSTLTIEQIKLKAKNQRQVSDIKIDRSQFVKSQKLSNTLQRCEAETGIVSAKKDGTATLQRGHFWSAPTGQHDRNDTLYSQARKIFEKSSLKIHEVFALVSHINNSCVRPLEMFEVQQIVRSAYKGHNRDSLAIENEEAPRFKTISDLAVDIFDYFEPTSKKLTLCNPLIDTETRGKLRGGVIGIIGDGGTKKSLRALNIAITNIQQNGSRWAKINIEMSNVQDSLRAISMMYEDRNGELEKTAHEQLEDIYQMGEVEVDMDGKKVLTTGREYVSEFILNDLSKRFSDLMLFSDRTYNIKEIPSLLESTEQEYGKLDGLILDGIAAFEADEQTMSKEMATISKFLNRIAQKFNILVMPIIHVPKSVTFGKRNLSTEGRDTGKFQNDFKAFISLTRIHTSDSEAPNYKYYNTYVCEHWWGKRFKGEENTTVYELETNHLRLKRSDKTLEDFENEVLEETTAKQKQKEEVFAAPFKF